MVTSLNCLCEASQRKEELKIEATLKMYKDTRKIDLEMFKLTQATQECMGC